MSKVNVEMYQEVCPVCGKVFNGYTEKSAKNQANIHRVTKHPA